MNKKYRTARLYLLEVNEIEIMQPNQKIQDLDIFIGSDKINNLFKDKTINLKGERKIYNRIGELEIFEDRDQNIKNSGSSKLIEDYGFLEKYINFINQNPEFSKLNILESIYFLHQSKEDFIKYNHFYPYPKDFFVRYINHLKRTNCSFFQNQKDNFYLNSSYDLLEALDELSIVPNFNFFNLDFGKDKNDYGFFFLFNHFKWLFKKGKKEINKKNKKHVINNLLLLIDRNEFKRLALLIESGFIQKNLIKAALDNSINKIENSSYKLMKKYVEG